MNSWRRLLDVLTLKCEGATILASRALDEPLPLADRIALYGHLLACAPCRRFRGQLAFIRRAMNRPSTDTRNPTRTVESLSLDAKERIARAMREALESEAEGRESVPD
ncbi:MAG: zf-HC2 domain-containing protein [Isosphaeraceae bacterium]